MKIAIVTDDEKTISEHFGHADKYLVVDLSDGQIAAREVREKPGHGSHHHGHDHDHDEHEHEHDHADRHAHVDKHHRMAAAIADCDILLAAGMGQNARNHVTKAGVEVLQIDISDIDEALQVYLAGEIEPHVHERSCGHHDH